MKVNQKKIGDNLVSLDVVATAEEVDKAFFMCGVYFAQQNNLQPEEGKTPAQVAEEALGIKDLDAIIAPDVVEYLIPFAIDKKNLTPDGMPTPKQKSPLQRGKDFRFELEVTLKPNYSLSSYDPVDIKLPRFVEDTEDADQKIAEMADHFAEYVTAEPRPVELGDACSIDMEATMNGEAVNALNMKGRTYVTGEGYMPESFEEQIIGMNVGETKSFTFEGPGFDEMGHDSVDVVDCTVTINEIQTKVIPEINDEWVAKYFPMMRNLESLRASINQTLNAQRRNEYDQYCRNIAAEALVGRFEGKIPDSAYEATSQSLIKNIRAEAARNGMTWKQFVDKQGGEQQFNMMLMFQTRQMLVQGYVLDAVFKHENLKVTEAEILAACTSLNPRDPESVRNQMEETGRGFALREMAERYCASDWVYKHANIEYLD